MMFTKRGKKLVHKREIRWPVSPDFEIGAYLTAALESLRYNVAPLFCIFFMRLYRTAVAHESTNVNA